MLADTPELKLKISAPFLNTDPHRVWIAMVLPIASCTFAESSQLSTFSIISNTWA